MQESTQNLILPTPKQVKGYNWGVFGGMDTGKTYICMEVLVKMLMKLGKRVIIFDHTDNPSYKEYTHIIKLNDLKYQLPPQAIYKIVAESEDFDEFCELVIKYVRNSVIVLDDIGVLVNSGLNTIRKKMIRTTKNNHNDVFYQVHSFSEAGPFLLENLQRVVLKEITSKKIPDKLPWQDYITWLLQEVILENEHRADGNLWSYRIFCVPEHAVIREVLGVRKSFRGREYFSIYENSEKKLTLSSIRKIALENNKKFSQ